MGTIATDIRYAFRGLIRAPVFALVVGAMIAIPTTGVTVMSGVLTGAFVRPLGYQRADRLVVLETRGPRDVVPTVSVPDVRDVRASSKLLADISLWQTWAVTVRSSDGEPTRALAASVDSRFFALLGMTPAVGRAFGPADDAPGHEPVVLLSYGFWQSAYGATADAIGRPIVIDGVQYTIVGVAADGFADPLTASMSIASPPFWRASPADFETTNRSWRGFRSIGRLAAGTSLAALNAELAVTSAALAEAWPATNADMRLQAMSLRERLVGAGRRSIVMLGTAVFLLLLVACANFANLLLVRGLSRSGEYTLRRVLGASAAQVYRPAVLENGLLAVIGLAAGVGLAPLTFHLLQPFLPGLGIPVAVALDPPMLIASAGLCLSIVAGFCAVPIWLATRPASGLPTGSRTLGGPGARLRGVLVVVEAALAVVLLIGAGLLVRSYQNLRAVDLGIDTANAVVATVTPSVTRYPDAASLDRVVADVLAAASHTPGVLSAGIVSALPLTGAVDSGWITRPDRPTPNGATPPSALYRTVAGDYFRAAGIAQLAGRRIDERDRADSPLVAVINQATAAVLFPGEDPLGRQVSIMGGTRDIVGLVADVREAGADAAAPMAVYVPFTQEAQGWATRSTTLVARVDSGNPAEFVAALRRAILSVDPSIAINGLQTLADVDAQAIRAVRFRTAVLSLFAGAAFALATVGLSSVVAFHVAQRRRELGLRMALGATRGRLLALLVGQGVMLAGTGSAIGLSVAGLSARWLERLVFDLSPTDPVIFGLVPAVFIATTALAALLPALSASSLDPAVVLREE